MDNKNATTETEEFINLLESERPERSSEKVGGTTRHHSDAPHQTEVRPGGDLTQWAVHANGVFAPCGATAGRIPGGVYRLEYDQFGNPLFGKIDLITDNLIELPDTASARVLESIQRFWKSEEKFKRFGQVFKRGVLLWGPPGSGKTVTITLLVRDLIQRGGAVVLATEPSLTTKALAHFRKVEPDRKLICILEDIDELTRRYGEAELLALLDGESQIGNVVYIASTNYPEELDARLINRPSRFDEVIKIPMPSAAARFAYLRRRLQVVNLSDDELEMWVEDTEGLSIAHLREMVVAIFCLGREYDETLTRLKAMQRTPKSTDGKVISLAPRGEKSKGYFKETKIPL